MRYLKYCLLLCFLVATKLAMAQVDRTKAPTPGAAPKIQIGKAKTFVLENGLQVIVVENHKVPRVSVQISADTDPVLEGENAGLSDVAGSLMQRGTTTRSKEQIDEAIDFMGASLSSSANGVYASCLTKHLPKVLDIMSDVLINPSFPKTELDKIIKQQLSALELAAEDPNAMMSNLSDVLVFGKNHPYGEITTPKTVQHITPEMCEQYYKTNFLPNVSYMVVVGDISPESAISLAKKYFDGWKKGSYAPTNYAMPQGIAKNQVGFVPKAGAVQSVVRISHTTDLKPGTSDALKMDVVNNILGASSYSRLFMNLREDKAYTYGAYSSYDADRLVGKFGAEASVRSSVTDSAITQFLYELNRIRTEPVKEEELAQVKNILNGNFARALENPQTVARFALNTAKYKLPADYYENYLKNIAAITAADVQETAKKYIKPENAYIMVVGDKKVAETLAGFGAVSFYDALGNVAKPVAELPKDLTANKVIDNYIKAIGGEGNIKKIKTLAVKMGAEVDGTELTIVRNYKAPNLYSEEIKVKIMSLQSRVFDGKKGVSKGMGSPTTEPKNDELDELKFDACIVPVVYLGEMGAKMVLLGSEDLNGVLCYVVQTTFVGGKVHTDFFDAATGLKLRSSQTTDGPEGKLTSSSDYGDYVEVSGVKMPMSLVQTVGGQKIKAKATSMVANGKMSAKMFVVK